MNFLSQFLTTGFGPCSVLFGYVPHHTFRYSYTFDEISPEYPLFQTEVSQLSQIYLWEMLQCQDHFCSPLLGSLQCMHTSLDPRNPELDSALHCVVSPVLTTEKGSWPFLTGKEVGGKWERKDRNKQKYSYVQFYLYFLCLKSQGRATIQPWKCLLWRYKKP